MNKSTIKNHFSSRQLVQIALMSSILCILAPFSIPLPFSPVPITFTNLILYLFIFILGWRSTILSYFLYLLLGLVGLPVFSGFVGGPIKLVGPTGGYLIGFFFLILISGLFIEKSSENKILSIIGLILGTLVCYLLGTMWLSWHLSISFLQGFSIGVIPYLVGDGVKIIIAVILGPILKKRLVGLH